MSRTRHALCVLSLLLLVVFAAACDGEAASDGSGDTAGPRDVAQSELSFGSDIPRADIPTPPPTDTAVPPTDVPVTCIDDGQCPAATPRCVVSTGTCVQCLVSADCAGAPCVAGECRAEETCTPNTSTCEGDTLARCGPDGRIAARTPCSGACVVDHCATCRPNELTCDGNDVARCNADGTAKEVVESCTGETRCQEGRCLVCYPTTKLCDGAVATRCNADGSGWEVAEDCALRNWDCAQGVCVNPCAPDPKGLTNAGCEFWATDLDNAYVEDETGVYDAQHAQFAVIVSNTSELGSAEVTITHPNGTVDRKSVATRSLETFLLPPQFSLDGSGVTNWGYHVVSTRPVTVYQFNPLANVDVFSNDASLLLPVPTFGTDYYVATYPEMGQFRGYFTVVASTAGATDVTVTPTANTLAGTRAPAMQKGVAATIRLQQGEVLNVESDEAGLTGFGGDLTGTRIQSTQPIGVFGGHEASVSGSQCCADHLEEQLLPVSRWGKRYVAARAMPRGGEPDYWMILVSEPDTNVTLSPRILTLPTPFTPGVPVRFAAREDFTVTADKPILLVQFLASSMEIGSASSSTCSQQSDCSNGFRCVSGFCEPIGDPSMMVAVPIDQYRKEYIFLTPNSYLQDFITVLVPQATSITLDGTAVPDASLTNIMGTTWRVYRTLVGDGVHVLTATSPVGLMVYGYDDDVSYGYAGGMGLEEINP